MSTLELPHYDVLEKIGAGGMGEVYRARDTRLDRTVALKRLPPELAQDPERLARLEREARLLASLHHPNIGMLYGLEEAEGTKILVLEYISGETISERLERGPLAIVEALEVARQVAWGLEKAHENDIVHRDLKPGNVMITEAGAVKILDFGLAKATMESSSSVEATQSPTLSFGPTLAGTILGTPAYMSPEQVRGQPVDQRTDVWAFGCLLYECLTATRPFAGETPGDQLASILSVEPEYELLPEKTPPRLQELVERCLIKNVEQRWRDIGDVRLEIEQVLRYPGHGSKQGKLARWRFLWPKLAGAVLLVITFALGSLTVEVPSPPSARAPVRFTIEIPEQHRRGVPWNPSVAISPDGERVVYVGYEGPNTKLFERRLGELEVRSIPGTERGSGPVFSPDGRWLLFSHPQGLTRLLLDGDNAAPLRVSSHAGKNGADWGRDGRIVCEGGWGGGLVVIEPDGKEHQLTEVEDGEGLHLWPQILPDRRSVLFTVWKNDKSFDEAAIAIAELDSNGHDLLPNVRGSGARVIWTSGGYYLLWMQGGALLAAPFDLFNRTVHSEDTIPLLDGILTTSSSGAGHYAISPAHGGTLVHLPGTLRMDQARLAWVSPGGKKQPFSSEVKAFAGLSISRREELRFSVVVRDYINQIDVYDAGWEVPRRVISDIDAVQSVLSPDGETLTIDLGDGKSYVPHRLPADGSGEAEPLFETPPPRDHAHVEAWSRDGRTFTYSAHDLGEETHDIYLVSLDSPQEHLALLATEDNEQSPRFSPNGEWIAYRRNKPGGRAEIWVKEIDGSGQLRVSEEGEDATFPQWSADGNELYYLTGTAIRVVGVMRDGELAPSRPREFFAPFYSQSEDWLCPYDVAPDGRLLIVETEPDSTAKQIQVTMNWFEEVSRRFAQ